MAFPEFHYMLWAKDHAGGPRYHLGRSGLGPPATAELWGREPAGALPPLGLEADGRDLVAAARDRVAARFGLDPAGVLLTLGASHGLFLACQVLIRPGDLVLVEAPAYEVLGALPVLLGARVEPIERTRGAGFGLPPDLDARIAATRPRLVVLSNPHNPTGQQLHRRELEQLAGAAARVGASVLVDEVYLEFDADPAAASLAGAVPNAVALSSLTKAYGLGALRFGWLTGAPGLVERAERFNDFVCVNYPAPSAWLGLQALDRLDGLRQRAARLRRQNLPVMARWVESRDDASWLAPAAGVMGWVRLARVSDTRAWCQRLLERWDTLVVPGEFFGAAGHVRIGFGLPEADLVEGLARIGRALDER